jgi:GH24 family phage-related lysozyme (muramidase)
MRRLTDCVRHTDLGLSHHRAFWEAVEAKLPPGSLANTGELGSIWTAAVAPKDGLDPAWMQPAVALLHEFEGLHLHAYQCQGKVWTIGWGSTRIFNRPVRQGDTISRTQADAQFRLDVDTFAAHLFRLLPLAKAWQPHRIAALVSFTYNVGASALESSSLRRRLLAGEDPVQVVSQELPRWNKADSKVSEGLTKRRKAEVELFVGHQLQQPTPPTDRTQWITQIKALNISQPDAVTCQAASIGMAVGDRDVQGIRRKLTAHGQAGDPAVMAHVIRSYGKPYRYEGNASLATVYDWLKAGEFLITHGWFTGSGHVICLDGLRDDRNGRYSFDVKDPWSEFNAAAWSYNLGSKFYDGFYSDLLIYAACVAGASSADAKRLYRAGKVDTARGGMWVHRFTTS